MEIFDRLRRRWGLSLREIMTEKVCIVLPANFKFSEERPNSIETVVRAINRESEYRDNLVVICDEGARTGADYEVIKVPAYSHRRQRNRLVRSLIADLQPDLLEIHQHAPSGRKIAAAFPDIPSILYRHNIVKNKVDWHTRSKDQGARLLNAYDRWRYERRYSAFNALLFVSDFARDEFVHMFPRFGGNSYSVPNPIDLAAWEGDTPVGKQKLLSYAGRAAPEKGLQPLAEALVVLLDRYPDWKAELALGAWDTHAPWAAEVMAPLARFGERCLLRKDVPRSEVQDLQRRAAITLIPSTYGEAFGLVAVEAHACRTAVVSSGSGGLREASGDFAEYLKAVDAPSIIEATSRLIEDDGYRQEMAEGGYDFVRTHHTISIRAAQLDRIRASLMTV